MKRTTALLAAGILSFAPFASRAAYLTLKCDTQTPGNPVVLDRVFTGNTPLLRAEMYERGAALSMTNWTVRFMYGYDRYSTNGLITISGSNVANTVIVGETTNTYFNAVQFVGSTTNLFESGEYYFSIIGTNANGWVKTFATGKMIQDYDPAADTSVVTLYRSPINWDNVTSVGTLAGIVLSNATFNGTLSNATIVGYVGTNQFLSTNTVVMAAIASSGTVAAAANVATSNSIAGAVTAGTSGLSVVYYPLGWGVIVSNLAAAGGGSVTLGDITNTVSGLVPPLIAGGTTLAATTATYAASAGFATNAGAATYATSAVFATNAGSATSASEAAHATNATTADTATDWSGHADLTNGNYVLQQLRLKSSATPGYSELNGQAADLSFYRHVTVGEGSTDYTIWDAGSFDTGTVQRVGASINWAQIIDPPALGTGDMTSNVFVTGSGVVGTAAVAQAWTGATATWSTQAANTVTGGLNTARITAAEVTNESNRVRVTAAEVTNEANRVRIVAAEVTNAANTAAIASTGALLAARSFGVLAGCTNLGDSTNLTIYGTHLCYLASPSNDYKITVDSGAARINYRIDIRSSSNVAYASGVSLYGAWTRTGTNCVIVSPDTGTLWQVRGKGE